jgi:predicted nucleotidyltransferase
MEFIQPQFMHWHAHIHRGQEPHFLVEVEYQDLESGNFQPQSQTEKSSSGQEFLLWCQSHEDLGAELCEYLSFCPILKLFSIYSADPSSEIDFQWHWCRWASNAFSELESLYFNQIGDENIVALFANDSTTPSSSVKGTKNKGKNKKSQSTNNLVKDCPNLQEADTKKVQNGNSTKRKNRKGHVSIPAPAALPSNREQLFHVLGPPFSNAASETEHQIPPTHAISFCQNGILGDRENECPNDETSQGDQVPQILDLEPQDSEQIIVEDITTVDDSDTRSSCSSHRKVDPPIDEPDEKCDPAITPPQPNQITEVVGDGSTLPILEPEIGATYSGSLPVHQEAKENSETKDGTQEEPLKLTHIKNHSGDFLGTECKIFSKKEKKKSAESLIKTNTDNLPTEHQNSQSSHNSASRIDLIQWDQQRRLTEVLTEDILDMASNLYKIAQLRRPWQSAAIERVRATVQSIWPQAQCDIFGSFGTGLAIPSSDVDIVVTGNLKIILVWWLMTYCTGIVNQLQWWGGKPITPLAILSQHLQLQDWVSTVRTIEHTLMPVIKITTAPVPMPSIGAEARKDYRGVGSASQNQVDTL